MIFSSNPAACVFANKCGEVRKSVRSFKDTLFFRDLRHKLCCELENQDGRMQLSVAEKNHTRFISDVI